MKDVPAGWRRVDPNFWYCSDVGSAVKRPGGWFASKSGYASVVLTPSVGPFKTARMAITVFEKVRKTWTPEPTASEVMEEALRGGGIVNKGLSLARNLWPVLVREVEILESAFAADGEERVEAEVEGFFGRVLGGVLARRRYAASLKAKRRRKA